MSNITRSTQNFYQQCRKATNVEDSPELIQAKHMGWNSAETQLQNFEVATNLPWIDWKEVQSVLDIGCGYGNLLEYLARTKLYEGKYWGIDIMPDSILQAMLNYSSKYKSCFLTGDFLERDWQQSFDIVISLGSIGINHDYPNRHGQKSIEYVQRFIWQAVRLCGSALSLYFLNADCRRRRYRSLAYYKISTIEAMIIEACGSRLEDLTFVSYPKQNDIKTIAKVKLSF